MLDQMEVVDTVLALSRVGRDATSYSVRDLLGGTHEKFGKIAERLTARGLLHSHRRRYRANCNSVCYSLTRKGHEVAEAVRVDDNSELLSPGGDNDIP